MLFFLDCFKELFPKITDIYIYFIIKYSRLTKIKQQRSLSLCRLRLCHTLKVNKFYTCRPFLSILTGILSLIASINFSSVNPDIYFIDLFTLVNGPKVYYLFRAECTSNLSPGFGTFFTYCSCCSVYKANLLKLVGSKLSYFLSDCELGSFYYKILKRIQKNYVVLPSLIQSKLKHSITIFCL